MPGVLLALGAVLDLASPERAIDNLAQPCNLDASEESLALPGVYDELGCLHVRVPKEHVEEAK